MFAWFASLTPFLQNLIAALFSLFVSALLAPRVQQNVDQPKAEKENTTPIAEEQAIVELHGTAFLPLNIVSYGNEYNYRITKDGQTVGINYEMSVHAVPCRAADEIIAARIGENVYWRGSFIDSVLTVYKRTFFAGGSVKNGFSYRLSADNGALHAEGYRAYDDPATLLPDFKHNLNLYFFNRVYDDRGSYCGKQRRFPAHEFAFVNTTGGWYPAKATIASQNNWQDKNPVNTIRDILSGGPFTFGSTWTTAADTVYDEGLGVSVVVDGTKKFGTLVKEICEHIDARVYTDRTTGNLEIKLIRQDYDVAALPTYDDNYFLKRPHIVRSDPSRSPNYLTVTYTSAKKDGKVGTLSLSDDGRVQQYGRQAKVNDYPYFTRRGAAAIALDRDLSALTQVPARGSITVIGLADGLNEGDPFILDAPRQGESNLICRVAKIVEGGARDYSTTIYFTEDVFSITEDFDIGDDPVTVDPATALAIDTRLVQEMPYFFGAVEVGTEFTDGLSANDDFGMVMASAEAPNNLHTGYDIYSPEVSDDPEDLPDAGFATTFTLVSDIARMQTTFEITDPGLDLTDKVILLGGEWMRVDTFTDTGANATITVGRGCFDVAPTALSAGAQGYYDSALNTDLISRDAADTVTFNLLSNAVGDSLELNDANDDIVDFDSRAIRPLPPKRFKVDGSYDDGATVTGAATLTWEATNRLTQSVTGVYPDHDLSTTITAEAGTTYQVRAKAYNGAGTLISTFVDTNVGTDLTDTYTVGSEPSGTVTVRLSVAAIRDGYESWTSPEIEIYLDTAMQTEGGALLEAENGDALETE